MITLNNNDGSTKSITLERVKFLKPFKKCYIFFYRRRRIGAQFFFFHRRRSRWIPKGGAEGATPPEGEGNHAESGYFASIPKHV